MKDKKNKLDFFSENLAFPEVHVDSQKNTDDNEPADPHGDVAIDNLAVPEVKVKDHKKKW
ncbi:MAG: hypothetical protein ACLUV5_01045 [Oscillospiraceae bacterium]